MIPKLANTMNLSGYLLSAVLSSVTNLGLSVGVARHGSVVEFGLVSLALLSYSVLVSLSASAFGTLCAIRPEFRQATKPSAHLMGAVILVSLSIVLPSLLLLIGTHPGITYSLVVVIVVLPLLLLHDFLRLSFFAQSRPWHSAWLDLAWLLLLVLCYGLLGIRGLHLLVAWALCAALVVIIALVIWRVSPDMRGGLRWIRFESKQILKLALDGFLSSLSTHITTLLTTGILGVTGIAAIRGGQVVIGPVSIAHSALISALAPRVATRMASSSKLARRFANVLSYGAGILILLVALVANQFPESLGFALLGDTWVLAQSTVVPLLIAMSAHVMATASQSILRSQDVAHNLLLRGRLMTSILVLGFCVAGAFFGGADGFCVGLAVARWIALLLWEWQVTQLRSIADPTNVQSIKQ